MLYEELCLVVYSQLIPENLNLLIQKNKYWVWEWDPVHKGTLTCLNKLHCPGTNWQAPSKNLLICNSSFTDHKASIKPAHVIFFWLTTSHTEMLQWATKAHTGYSSSMISSARKILQRDQASTICQIPQWWYLSTFWHDVSKHYVAIKTWTQSNIDSQTQA